MQASKQARLAETTTSNHEILMMSLCSVNVEPWWQEVCATTSPPTLMVRKSRAPDLASRD